MKQKKWMILGSIVVLIIAILFFFYHKKEKEDRLQIQSLKETEYKGIFINSLTCENMPIEKLQSALGQEVIQSTYKEGLLYKEEIYEAIQAMNESANPGLLAYIEVDPTNLDLDRFYNMLKDNPDDTYYIIMRPYSLEKWKKIIEKGEEFDYIESCKNFANKMLSLSNMNLYYYGNKDWMTKNPFYFNEKGVVSERGMYEIYAEIEASVKGIYSTKLNINIIETQVVVPKIVDEVYTDILESNRVEGENIVFLGDSMYGKEKNESGIAEIASELLGANVYNYGINGASITGESEKDFGNIINIVEASQKGDFEGVIIPEQLKDMEEKISIDPKYIVLRYGFNDYSRQSSIDEFKSVLSEGIEKLKVEFPNTNIILSSPTIAPLDYGFETELVSYVIAMEEVATMQDVEFLNNYDLDLEYLDEKPYRILVDGVHYNINGRYRQAVRLAEFISELE